MKLNTNHTYKEYRADLVSSKFALVRQKEEYENSKNYLLSRLEPFEHYINNFTNVDYLQIKELDRLISERSLVNLVEIANVNVDHIRRTINIIVTINKDLERINNQLTDIDLCLIDNALFRDIVYKFNSKISDEIVYKGYVLSLGSGLNHIRIKKIDCRNRIKKRINWNESNKKKAEILARGGIPYRVTERDENRKIVTDNGGEHWHIYFANDFDYLWHWHKGRCLVNNSQYYKFRPTVYNNTTREGKMGNVNKLKQLVTCNSPLLSNFLISHK